MGLTYHFEFSAPATVPAGELEIFLRDVEQRAKSLGFDPTLVLNVAFDNEARRQFARRIGGYRSIQDDRLKGVVLPSPHQIEDHSPSFGDARLIPSNGVLLVVTDEHGAEVCFGFFRYPPRITDVHGRTIAETDVGDDWAFRDHVKSPDPRYRTLVQAFREQGFVVSEKDEFPA